MKSKLSNFFHIVPENFDDKEKYCLQYHRRQKKEIGIIIPIWNVEGGEYEIVVADKDGYVDVRKETYQPGHTYEEKSTPRKTNREWVSILHPVRDQTMLPQWESIFSAKKSE